GEVGEPLGGLVLAADRVDREAARTLRARDRDEGVVEHVPLDLRRPVLRAGALRAAEDGTEAVAARDARRGVEEGLLVHARLRRRDEPLREGVADDLVEVATERDLRGRRRRQDAAPRVRDRAEAELLSPGRAEGAALREALEERVDGGARRGVLLPED